LGGRRLDKQVLSIWFSNTIPRRWKTYFQNMADRNVFFFFRKTTKTSINVCVYKNWNINNGPKKKKNTWATPLFVFHKMLSWIQYGSITRRQWRQQRSPLAFNFNPFVTEFCSLPRNNKMSNSFFVFVCNSFSFND
jgi:hypothetical protein